MDPTAECTVYPISSIHSTVEIISEIAGTRFKIDFILSCKQLLYHDDDPELDSHCYMSRNPSVANFVVASCAYWYHAIGRGSTPVSAEIPSTTYSRLDVVRWAVMVVDPSSRVPISSKSALTTIFVFIAWLKILRKRMRWSLGIPLQRFLALHRERYPCSDRTLLILQQVHNLKRLRPVNAILQAGRRVSAK